MQVETKGFKELREKLGDLEGIQALAEPLRDNAEEFRTEMALYPPQRTTTYVRTLRLGGGWHVEPVKKVFNGLEIIVGNNMKYAHWVQSRLLQAWMHKDHWQTEEDVIERLADKQLNRIENFISRLLGG